MDGSLVERRDEKDKKFARKMLQIETIENCWIYEWWERGIE